MKIEQNKEKLCRAIFFNTSVISLEIFILDGNVAPAMCLISVLLLPVCVEHVWQQEISGSKVEIFLFNMFWSGHSKSWWLTIISTSIYRPVIDHLAVTDVLTENLQNGSKSTDIFGIFGLFMTFVSYSSAITILECFFTVGSIGTSCYFVGQQKFSFENI